MNKYRFSKILICFALCLGMFIGAKSTFADSIRVDARPTLVPGFIRYCFQVTNDDQNEPNPNHRVEHIALLTIKCFARNATKADHQFRDNITGPNLWDAKVTINNNVQTITWTFDGYFGSNTTKYTVDKPDETIKPGNRSEVFSFIVNGEIFVKEFETGFQQSPGSYRNHCKTPGPFGDMLITEDNDTDFLKDDDSVGTRIMINEIRSY